LLKRAEQAMVRTQAAALKSVGISLGQYVALVELERQPSVTAATLARACLVTPQAMMILLRSLEEQGLVARKAHPRHANILEISLTDAGREALHASVGVIKPIEDHVLSAFTKRELATLQGLLTRFSQAFGDAAAASSEE
jgi:DNA-binding MarR family transcriptional regulator